MSKAEGQANKYKTAESAKGAFGKAKESISDVKELVIQRLDVDGDGQVGIEDIIVLSFKTPGVYINREIFLRKQLFKNHPKDVIDKAIKTTPALAGISQEEIDQIAEQAIIRERTKVSGVAVALAAPGGLAMAATIPADIIQNYGFTLRAVQKLLYLYGFPDVDSSEQKGVQLDEQTMNTIILCLGIMNGVTNANNAMKGIAYGLAKGVDKKLMNMALTKGPIFPVVKEVMKWFGVKLTTGMFRDGIKKAIPFLGGVIGGGLTFATFKPCCNRLKKELKDTLLANPNYKPSENEVEMFNSVIEGNIIEAEFSDAGRDANED